MMEGVIVAGMVLLALYGAAQLWIRTVMRLLRPKEPQTTVLLRLGDDARCAEQQIRYAWYTAKEQRLPLVVLAQGADAETESILHTMLDGKGVCVIFEENCARDACTYG